MGRYPEFLLSHPDYLPVTLNVIFAGFADDTLAPGAAFTVKQYGRTVGALLLPYIDRLLEFVETRGATLDVSDAIDLFDGVGHVISHAPDGGSLRTLGHRLCGPILQRLASLCEAAMAAGVGGGAGAGQEMSVRVRGELDRLASSFYGMCGKIASHPEAERPARRAAIFEVFAAGWSLIEQCAKWRFCFSWI